MTPVQQSAQQIGLNQLACSCGGGQPPQIVFALGALWFDFGTEARYDAIVQQLGDPVRANTPSQLFAFLRENPHFVSGITFILMQDQIPLYAVQPAGPFAPQTYSAIFDALESSLDEKHSKEQRVSIPGLISGSTRLLNGMTVPVIYPDLRGMYKWQSHELIAAAKAAVGKDVASEDEILNFLNRVYYELRNLGVAPQERAINFAATNAYQTQVAFAESAGRNLALDSIQVVKSPICRPDSDCWDVQLQMFDPENERRASRVYRYTVDVSEMLPVTVGSVRSWVVRTGTL
jgi:cyanobactin maturation PatA/PatG family protease